MALAAFACGALGGEAPLSSPRRAPRGVASSLRGGHAPRMRAPRPAAPSPVAPAPTFATQVAPAPASPPAAPAGTSDAATAPEATSIPAPLPPPVPVPVPGEPTIAWRFRSAAPLSGSPAVNAAGLVYVASVEGFLHALAPDGTYRWSYGLTGMPIGAPAVDPAGNVYVATSAQRLYAFKPDGHLHWTQTASARFASPPVWAEPGLVYYAGRDRNLYSVATWGSAPKAHWLGRSANGSLASLGGGAVAVGVDGAEVQLFRRASSFARVELAAALEQPLLGGKARWFALTRAGLVAYDLVTRAETWAAPARRAGASADERWLVIEVGAELVWRDPATGVELHRMQLRSDASAAPVVTNSGVALVPLVSGRLLVLEPARGHRAVVALGPAPAWPPAWSEASLRATAAAGGDVIGIDLSEWVASPRPEPVETEETPPLEPAPLEPPPLEPPPLEPAPLEPPPMGPPPPQGGA